MNTNIKCFYAKAKLNDGEIIEGDHTSLEEMRAAAADEGIELTDAVLEEGMESLRELFKNIKDLDYLQLTVKGNERFIHPERIVWVELCIIK